MPAFQSTRRNALIALAAASATRLGVAQAQTAAPTPAAAMAPTGAKLTIRDIYDRVQAAGLHAIREIEWDDGRYEVKARNTQGERVKLYVNGSTGEIERTRTRR